MTTYNVRLGNPTAGMTVEFDIDEGTDPAKVCEIVEEGLDNLKIAGDTWRAWSLENESDEEKEIREVNEAERALLLRRKKMEMRSLERMLDGDESAQP